MWKWILFIRKNLLPLAKMEIIMFWDSPLPSSNRCRELRLVNISTNRMAIQKYGDKDFHLSIKSYWNVYHLTPQITSQTNYHNRQYFKFHPKELNYVKYWTFFWIFRAQSHNKHHKLVHIWVHCYGTNNEIPTWTLWCHSTIKTNNVQ